MKHSQFDIIGISVRTTNENGQSSIDIPELWRRLFTENILERIPGKLDTSIYCVYTDYEKDFTKPYTAILGCRVENLNTIPEGMVGKVIPGGDFVKFIAKGDVMQGSVFFEWKKIWDSKIPRKYTADFEVYGEKAQDLKNSEVDIFIAVE